MAIKDPDDLYGLPLDRFVAERTALVRGLRAEGNREQAGHVAALRKPSVAAWAVNQLVRSQRRAINELFAAGDRARRAQSDLIAGRGDGGALRDASHNERLAVDRLVEAARGLLTSGGHGLSGATLERVADTLNAGALDEDARARVAEGRLERELKHVGLVGGIEAAPAPSGRGGKARDSTGARASKALESSGARTEKAREAPARRAREEARKAEEVRRAARIAEGEARRRVERAGKAVQVAEERRERAAQSLEEAEEALAKAHAEADQAADEHSRANAELGAT